jgi:glycerate 2-kinase
VFPHGLAIGAHSLSASKNSHLGQGRSAFIMNHRQLLTDYFRHGVAAASPRLTLPPVLPTTPPSGRTFVLGCGKAAAEMAQVAVKHLTGHVTGCVVTRHGHITDEPLLAVDVIEARHPLPDGQSLLAAERLLKLAATAVRGDRVIFLISGGGSSLICAPAPGVSFGEKQEMTDHLIRSGAPIEEINLVRRHLSRIKGGRLAAIAGARGAEIMTYVISDVADNDPALVASGPSISAAFVPQEAIAILETSGWPVAPHIAQAINDNPPPPVPNHPIKTIATNADALNAVTVRAKADGWTVIDLGGQLTGDAAATGKDHAATAMTYAQKTGKFLLVSGGELTVTNARIDGCGGPNLEYLTGLLSGLGPTATIEAVAGDTDGIDGSEDNAGGYITAAWADHADCASALAANRTYDLFKTLGGLVVTGPTRTNVNDIRMIAVEGKGQ